MVVSEFVDFLRILAAKMERDSSIRPPGWVFRCRHPAHRPKGKIPADMTRSRSEISVQTSWELSGMDCWADDQKRERGWMEPGPAPSIGELVFGGERLGEAWVGIPDTQISGLHAVTVRTPRAGGILKKYP